MTDRNFNDGPAGVSARFGKTVARMAGLSALVLSVAACGAPPGPSVPMGQGRSLAETRAAFETCKQGAEKAGHSVLTANFVGSVLWGGLVFGPFIIAGNQERIQQRGAANYVDRCLAKQGFTRRELTQPEVVALKQRDLYAREQLLTHLIDGGSLATYTGP